MSNVPWEVFIVRRSLDVGLFLQTHSIVSRDAFLQKLSSMGVDSPSQEYLEILFPTVKTEDPVEESSTTVTTTTAKRKK